MGGYGDDDYGDDYGDDDYGRDEGGDEGAEQGEAVEEADGKGGQMFVPPQTTKGKVGQFRTFKIMLDKRLYEAGDTLKGQLVVHPKKTIQLQTIKAKYIGHAMAKWKDGPDQINFKEEPFFKIERIMDAALLPEDQQGKKKKGLFGGKKKKGAKQEKTMSLGSKEHRFDFEYKLPAKLANNFKGEHGAITYSIQIYAELGGKSSEDPLVDAALQVQQTLDVNLREHLKSPESKAMETFGFLCFPSGAIAVTAHLLASAACAGEQVLVKIEVNNSSKKNITGCTVNLLQTSTFSAHGRSIESVRPFKAVVASDRAMAHLNKKKKQGFFRSKPQPVGPDSKWAARFSVPAGIPSTYTGHRDDGAKGLVSIKYELVIAACDGAAIRAQTLMPLIVGNVAREQALDMDQEEQAWLPAPPPPPAKGQEQEGTEEQQQQQQQQQQQAQVEEDEYGDPRAAQRNQAKEEDNGDEEYGGNWH